jgi:hypothetical protein
MKRRLVLAATTLALLGGAAGIASAATPAGQQTPATANLKPQQLCLVFYYDDGSPPSHLCVDY